MSCPDLYDGGNDLTGLVTNFSCTHSMYSDFSASATLQNPNCELGVNTITGSCTPIFAKIDASAVGLTDSISPSNLAACYNQNPKWVAGLLSTFGEEQDGISDKVDITVSSYFQRLQDKPISTYLFSSNSQSVLQQLLDYFAGIPNSLYSYTVVSNPVWGSIDGGSVMDAIKVASQCSMSNTYVQVGGVLETRVWKDHTSAVDLVIPSEMVGPVNKRASQLVPRLAVLVRGAKIDTAGCGERVVSDSRLSSDEGGISSNPGPSKHTAISGIDTKSVKAVLANLNADKDDLKEAQVLRDGNIGIEGVKAEDGNIKFNIVPQGAPNAAISTVGVQSRISAFAAWKQARKAARENDKAIRSMNYQMGRLKHNQLALQKKLAELFSDPNKPSYFPASSLGGMAGGPDTKAQKTAGNLSSNQTTNDQLEVFVYNNNAGTECGNSFEEIENSICKSRDVLFRIGVRRHQEMLLDNNTFQVQFNHYIPCLRLNQVVEFYTPGTSTCPPRKVKGLVTEIQTNYTAEDSSVKQTAAIADLDVLGNTTYTSSNLIDWQCGGGANAITGNPWEAAALTIDSNVTIQDTVLTLYGSPPATLIFAYLNQFLQQGWTYTLQFDYERLFGASAMIFNNTAGGGATLPGPIGTYTETFSASTATPQFQWSIINPLGATMWKINNLRLTRTMVA